MEVRVPQSLKSYKDFDKRQLMISMISAAEILVCQMLPVQKLGASWDPTGADLSSGGWLQDWHWGSVSSGYWEHTEANGSS